VKKSPTTDYLDDIIRRSDKLIDRYQKYERGMAKLIPFVRNYVNEKYIGDNLKEVQAIKEELEIISTEFEEFKKVHRKEFDSLMQEYIDKYDDYVEAVMYSINRRLILQNVLFSKNGTLLGNLALIREVKNAVYYCWQSALEVNKIVGKMKNNA
jgi:hypothetical protein